MKKTLPTVLWILMTMFATTGHGQTPDDFAHGLALSADRSAPIVEIQLPATVYETVTRPDLGDIRVFNGRGEVIPHAVRSPRIDLAAPPRPQALPFFPLVPSPDGSPPGLDMLVTTNNAGMLLSLQTDREQVDNRSPSQYILDASALGKAPGALKLEWTGQGGDATAAVDLDSSSDLGRWTRLVSGAALADLRFGDDRLLQDIIRIDHFSGKYLRLSWPLGKMGLTLARVWALFPPSSAALRPDWKQLSPTAFDEKKNEYFFDAQGFFPVDRLRIIPPQPNTLTKVGLFSRADSQADWKPLYTGLIYNLEADGNKLMNEDLEVPVVRTRYFLLRVDPESVGFGAGNPTLALGWLPENLYFATRGEGPFTLAFGSASTPAAKPGLDPLLTGLDSGNKEKFIRRAKGFNKIELGGPRRLTAAPPPRPWKTYILWAVLILGVLALALMARRLFREINH
ncbi:MAG: DUF3999 domain-containing protein [Pseudomonadota bacterium]